MNARTGTVSHQFKQQEKRRRILFGATWEDRLPKVFEDVPKYYKEANFFASLGLCPWWMNNFTDNISLQPGTKVLDVATGTHEAAIQVMQKNPGVEMHAIDRSAEMVAFGQDRAQNLGLSINARIGDIHYLPYEDDSFDAVTLSFASRHLKVAQVFKEVFRVLKPGGLFYHNDMLRPERKIIEVGYLSFLRVWVPVTAMVFHSTQDAKSCAPYFVHSIREMYSPSELKGLMEHIGFSDVRYRDFLSGALAFHSARK